MNSQTTYNKLPKSIVQFLQKVEQHIGYPLHFYGSVQRSDFILGKSDIDIDIFTHNTSSTIARIQSILLTPLTNVKKIACKLNTSNTLVYGQKMSYIHPTNKTPFEFSIFNIKDKHKMLKYHMSKTIIPSYISFFLIILKQLFYNLKLIPVSTFKTWKNFLMNHASSRTNNSLFIYL
jgi:hypothetical protein